MSDGEQRGGDPQEAERALGQALRDLKRPPSPSAEADPQARRSIDEIMLRVESSPTPPLASRRRRRALIAGLVPAAGLAAAVLLLLARPLADRAPARPPEPPTAVATVRPGPPSAAAAAAAAAPAVAEEVVELSFEDPAAQQVSVAGDFNSWSLTSHPLRAQQGRWVIRLSLRGGSSYRYAFHVTDGSGRTRWALDPRADRRPDGLGGVNAVLRL